MLIFSILLKTLAVQAYFYNRFVAFFTIFVCYENEVKNDI
jgi:hypothetical protein